MTKSINLKDLISVLKKAWWKILIFTVIVAVGVGLFAQFVIPRKYTSNIEFMVNNANKDYDYTTTSLTAAAEALAKDYIKIISGDKMIGIIKEYVADPNRDVSGNYAKLTDAQIRGMIGSSTSTGGSSVFSITITSTEDRNLAFYIAECISLKAPDVITEIARPSYSDNVYEKLTNGQFQKIENVQGKAVSVIRNPIPASTHSSPNVKTYVLISALLAAAASYMLFVVIKMFDNVITSEEDVREKLNKTIIGDIPEWSLDASARKEENN